MSEGLTRDEDTALRCLAALSDVRELSEEHEALLNELALRDRRSVIRKDGTQIPAQRPAS
ncbi:MAG: hypothetical protein QOG34_1085 [Frankiaceae bacterium]|jgi:hypothetical protein|nr:hypothetical protein [Frankiaceae bacterium]